MLLAKIIDTANGREELLMQRHAWYLCPYVLGHKTVCGYWETRCELFMSADGEFYEQSDINHVCVSIVKAS